MIQRKIQLVGKRSYAISLPKDWVIANKLKPHDNVYLEHGTNNSILVQTRETPSDKENNYVLSNIPNIEHFLSLCYQRNIDTLTLKSKEITNEQRARIGKMLRNLDGYDIVNETNKEITISFLFKDVNVNLKKIIVRMVYLLKLMVDSVKDHNEFTLIENENALDRLYYLGQRILFASTYNNKVRNENEIASTEDIFFYVHIIKKMEQLGDVIEALENKKIKDEELVVLKDCVKILSALFVKQQSASKVSAEFEKNKKNYEAKLIDRITSLTEDIVLNAMSIEYNSTFFSATQ